MKPTAKTSKRRAWIEGVSPEIDAGRFAIKRTPGEAVVVEADVFADGHDALTSVLRWRHESDDEWHEADMEHLVNDRWRGEFTVTELGRYRYCVTAWVDRFRTWRRDLRKKVDADQDVSVDLLVGAELVEAAAKRAKGDHRKLLREWAKRLEDEQVADDAFDPALFALMEANPDRRYATIYDRELTCVVDPPRAGFSSWYEFFPRSTAAEPDRHGTFADAERMLPYVARLGFDVVYLPPIHPIGVTNRKGKNNNPVSEPDDVGSPWAIGSEDGGHKSVNPDLGTLDDFRRFVAAARDHGLEVALDIAYQCSPDHPYVKEHPEWFRHRPDGTIQYAENPPKRYEDIYPIDFETDAWQELWEELRSVVEFWIDQGVNIFRVDNPHTKAFAYWEWMINEVKAAHPRTIFLSEAFTRPRVMYGLAKLGFTQSYTYFTWRNAKWDLTEYFTELTQTEVREYFRPNLWPNTPDILNEYLQIGGRPAFMTRLILAATLGANYGIYGPPFELCQSESVAPGKEEYLHSEKYELRQWDLDHPDSLADLIARVNVIRRTNPALQTDRTLRFHDVDNEQIIAYSKSSPDGENLILTVVNLDPYHVQSGWVGLPLDDFGLSPEHPYPVQDLLTEARYIWHGSHNYVELDPGSVPAHVFSLRQPHRTEQDFEQYS